MKPAFSTVACPDWTFERIARAAPAWGFLGVEFRTFGNASTRMACDPALTSPAKVRTLMRHSGLHIASLATGVRFDERVTPPIIGRVISRTEHGVGEGRSAADLADAVGAPYIRVFAFEIGSESRVEAVARITDRLGKVVDHCRNTGVRVALENGGSFPTAADLAEIIDAVGDPLLFASYSLAVGAAAGEDPAFGINVLGEKLALARVREFRDGLPCQLGEGEVSCRPGVEALARAGFGGPIVYEYDRLWFPDATEPDAVLTASARALFEWAGVRRAPVPGPAGRQTACA